MTIKVCLAGATGWAGAELARAIARAADLELVVVGTLVGLRRGRDSVLDL